MTEKEREIDAKAQYCAKWAVIPLQAANETYEPTIIESRMMRQYAITFTTGARWALGLP